MEFMSINDKKAMTRSHAKRERRAAFSPDAKIELIKQFPADRFGHSIYAGYWPLKDEIDICPLMEALSLRGHNLCLPCTPPKGAPLKFRQWHPGDVLQQGLYNTCEPYGDKTEIVPSFVFVPLLAFTLDGRRLGYGGGFYDRTLAKLRAETNVFACGVGFAGQETRGLPTDEHDEQLDGILTEQYFKAFK